MEGSYGEYVPLVTVLREDERKVVSEQARGFYRLLHHQSLSQAVFDVADGKTNSVLLSLDVSISEQDRDALKYMFHAFPTTRLLGFRASPLYISDDMMLQLGSYGMTYVINAHRPTDWFYLRKVLHEGGNESMRIKSLRRISEDIKPAPRDCRKFFDVLFSKSPHTASVSQLASYLKISPSTLNTRFKRAGLPSPKDYLVYARLVGIAQILENRGISAGKAALRMRYSSQQMFHKHVRRMMGMGAEEFRSSYNEEKMLGHFREQLILPYLGILAEFRPLNPKHLMRDSK